MNDLEINDIHNCTFTEDEASGFYWDGMYASASFFADGITILLWVSWMMYVCCRTVLYEINKIPGTQDWRNGGLDNVADLIDWDYWRNTLGKYSRCLCFRLDEVFEEYDHTYTRSRSIRLFCCVHSASGILAFVLFFSCVYQKLKDTWVCSLQGVFVQFAGSQIFFYLPIIFLWILVDECVTNRSKLLKCFRKKRRVKRTISTINRTVSADLGDLEQTDLLDEDKTIDEPENERIEQRRHEDSGGTECPFSFKCFVLLPIELLVYASILTFATLSVIIPATVAHEFREGKHHGHWCWIGDFRWQVGVFYFWLWFCEFVMCVLVVVMCLWVTCFYKCKKKKTVLLKFFCYTFVLIALWIPASFHRVYLGAGGKDHQILGYLQDVTTAIYGSCNVLIFYSFLFLRVMRKSSDNKKDNIMEGYNNIMYTPSSTLKYEKQKTIE